MKNVLIKNYSDYSFESVVNYMAGYTTELFGKIRLNYVGGDSPDADTTIYVLNA